MTERDLHPRRYHVYRKDGTHYLIELKPRWETQPKGPDDPESWGQDPMWDADISINGVNVSRQELLSLQAGSKPITINPIPSNEAARPQNGSIIDKPVADAAMNHFISLMDELYDEWLRDQSADRIVTQLLSDDE